MKKLFKLIFLEIKFLWRTLAIVFLIMTAFSTALLSVVSVTLDTRIGASVGVDRFKNGYYDNFGAEAFAVTLHDKSFADMERYGAECIYAERSGVTENTQIISPSGATFLTDSEQTVDGATYVYRRHGVIVRPQDVKYLYGIENAAFQNGDILLSDGLAEELSVTVGETVFVGGEEHNVKAVFEYGSTRPPNEIITDVIIIPKAYFYVVADSGTFDNVYLTCNKSLDIFALSQRLQRKGFDVELNWLFRDSFEHLNLMLSLYVALTALMLAMLFLAEYLLFSLIVRQRRTQICRYRMLGATNGTVSAIYLAICVSAVVLSCAIATLLSVWLSKYFLTLYDMLFNGEYIYRFRVWIPFSALAFELALLLPLFALEMRRISRMRIAEAVRYD